MSANTKPRLRLELGAMAHDSHVFYIDDSGNETALDRAVSAVHVSAVVGEPTKATLETLFVGTEAAAELEGLIVKIASDRNVGTTLVDLRSPRSETRGARFLRWLTR